jgi:hypothetical protein
MATERTLPKLELRVQRQAEPSDAVAVHSLVELLADGLVVWRCHGIESAKHLMAAGTYYSRWTRSPRFSREATARLRRTKPNAPEQNVYTWEVQDVYDGLRKRAGLRIHAVNYARDLLGCLALGMQRIDLDRDGTLDIARSRAAMDLFHAATHGHREMTVHLLDP